MYAKIIVVFVEATELGPTYLHLLTLGSFNRNDEQFEGGRVQQS